jgi:hypothetical protein
MAMFLLCLDKCADGDTHVGLGRASVALFTFFYFFLPIFACLHLYATCLMLIVLEIKKLSTLLYSLMVINIYVL